MPRVRLTDALAEKLNSSTDRRQEFFDALMPGLALRVSKHGRKSWVLYHRVGDKQVRDTLGRYPVIALHDARDRARTILQGGPRKIITVQPAAPVRLFADTFREFIERYAKVNNRSWQQTERLIERRVNPFWGDRPLSDITRTDIVTLLDDIVDDGAPVQANHVLAHVRKFFNWCADRGYVEKSPCSGIALPTRVESRDRVLTDDELKRVWIAAGDLAAPFDTYVKVLILTGQRRGEVAGMMRSELFDDIWTIPKSRTKNKTAHQVPLSPLALKLIAQPADREFLFTTTGITPVSGFSKLKIQLDKAVGFSDWRLHDLRRTCATGMARLGAAPHVIEKVLNHKTGQIRGVALTYNRHAYAVECRDALDRWAAHVQAISL